MVVVEEVAAQVVEEAEEEAVVVVVVVAAAAVVAAWQQEASHWYWVASVPCFACWGHFRDYSLPIANNRFAIPANRPSTCQRRRNALGVQNSHIRRHCHRVFAT